MFRECHFKFDMWHNLCSQIFQQETTSLRYTTKQDLRILWSPLLNSEADGCKLIWPSFQSTLSQTLSNVHRGGWHENRNSLKALLPTSKGLDAQIGWLKIMSATQSPWPDVTIYFDLISYLVIETQKMLLTIDIDKKSDHSYSIWQTRNPSEKYWKRRCGTKI